MLRQIGSNVLWVATMIALLRKLAERVSDLEPSLIVETACRFIEQKHWRIPRSARDDDALTLTGRQLAASLADIRRISVGQIDDRGMDAGQSCRVSPPRLWRPACDVRCRECSGEQRASCGHSRQAAGLGANCNDVRPPSSTRPADGR